MNILSSCLRALALPPAPSTRPHPATAAAPALPVLADEATAAGDAATAPGCGWFDSSWELERGLAVHEWPASDAPVAALWFDGAPGAASARLQ